MTAQCFFENQYMTKAKKLTEQKEAWEAAEAVSLEKDRINSTRVLKVRQSIPSSLLG